MDAKLAIKIYNVMCATASLEKDLTVGKGSNSYRAIGEKTVLNMVKPLFKEQKLIILPVDGEINEITDKYETVYNGDVQPKLRAITQMKVYFDIIDVETGESVRIVGFGNGADSQDKGSGKAFTYALKTALSKSLLMFSGEDTDNTHSNDIDPSQKVSKPNAKEMDVLVEVADKKGFDYAHLNASVVKTYSKQLTQLTTVQYVEVLKKISALPDKE